MNDPKSLTGSGAPEDFTGWDIAWAVLFYAGVIGLVVCLLVMWLKN